MLQCSLHSGSSRSHRISLWNSKCWRYLLVFRDSTVLCSAPRVSGSCRTNLSSFFRSPQAAPQLLKASIRFCLQDTGGRCSMPRSCSSSVSSSAWYDLLVEAFLFPRLGSVLSKSLDFFRIFAPWGEEVHRLSFWLEFPSCHPSSFIYSLTFLFLSKHPKWLYHITGWRTHLCQSHLHCLHHRPARSGLHLHQFLHCGSTCDHFTPQRCCEQHSSDCGQLYWHSASHPDEQPIA